jgi:hypothetical protein
MNVLRFHTLLASLLLLTAIPAICQLQEEDVVILKDGHVFRGTVAEKLTPGGTVSVTQADGKVIALFWEELVVVKRLPAGIADSILVQSFLPARGKFTGPPRIDLKGYERSEDVLFTRDGGLRRGVQLGEGIGGWVGLWTDGKYVRFPQSAIAKSVHVDRGIADSMLIMTHINTPAEWTEGERRYLTLFGGFAIPVLGDAKVEDVSSRTLDASPVVGIEVGFRIARGIRWVTSATYSSHMHGSIAPVGAIEGVIAPDMKARIITGLTGAEIRTIGPSLLQFRGFLQAGVLMFSEPGFKVTFPQSFYHLSGEAAVEDMSANALAISAGGGIVAGRFTFDVRWLLSAPKPLTRATIKYQYNNPVTIESTDDRTLSIFMITAGFSPF